MCYLFPRILFVFLCLQVCVLTNLAQAALIYNESVNGELSGTIGIPTVIGTLDLGINNVIGSTTSSPLDRDFWIITIPTGQRLSTVTLRSYTTTDAAGGGFMAVYTGTLTTIPTNDVAGQSQLLGGTLVGFAAGRSQGDNVLDDLGLSTAVPNAQKFSGPLPAGTYTFWTQEATGNQTYNYEFNVTAVPEPSTIALVGLLLGGLFVRRRRARVNHR
ncbi:MAG: PEP-CTERM sorting domain-containing protein [Planctomycetota bacterium]|nr:PEP-CTERM sorting domain-containing protein [Planctomycetota bacterium]